MQQYFRKCLYPGATKWKFCSMTACQCVAKYHLTVMYMNPHLIPLPTHTVQRLGLRVHSLSGHAVGFSESHWWLTPASQCCLKVPTTLHFKAMDRSFPKTKSVSGLQEVACSIFMDHYVGWGCMVMQRPNSNKAAGLIFVPRAFLSGVSVLVFFPPVWAGSLQFS